MSESNPTEELIQYQTVQNIALRVLRDIVPFIRAGVSEAQIAAQAHRLLEEQGVSRSWYYGVPTLVLVGERTTLSLSRKDYVPDALEVQWVDLVTIDLNPLLGGRWGDCARSYMVAEGRVVSENAAMQFPDLEELCDGMITERKLHQLLHILATPSMSMAALYHKMNDHILRLGYENLEVKGSLGQSIERQLEDRLDIEAGNTLPLGECRYFTFEPHIGMPGGIWGFKRKNIYYFEAGRLRVLGNPELLDIL